MFDDPADFIAPLRRLHAEIRDAVVAACEAQAVEQLSEIAEEDATGDTIYAVDKVSEELLIAFVEREIAPRCPVVLAAEGLPGDGEIVLPRGADRADARWKIIVDPIDGTRGLMYQKRSAWILSGVAPLGEHPPRLRDVAVAVMTEIPLVKQHLSDELWAVRGGGAQAARFNRLDRSEVSFVPRPSQADSIAHGFAMISRFFPGAREELAAIDEAVVRSALGPVQPGKAHCFEDQYISSGGQLYELIVGHDRFNADLRPLVEPLLAARGLQLGICCHPYDLCTALVAEEAGVILTDAAGGPLDGPLDIHGDVAWVGYANPAIRAQIEPALQAELAKWPRSASMGAPRRG